jgi:GNAT superfamily N-acetyltransferase
MIVRPVAEGDFDQWLPLWEAYNAFYERPTPPREITETTWTRFLDPDGPVHALVAEEQARIVGFAHYLFHASTTAVGQVCYLQDLLTAEDVRGKGIGRALIEAVAARAAGAGSKRLYWQTRPSNTTARALYEKVATDAHFMVYARELS